MITLSSWVQFLPLISGGENGWAHKLLGGPPKPEATPRAGTDSGAAALDRRSSQEQQRHFRPRVEPEEDDEEEGGEAERLLHSQFGTKIQTSRYCTSLGRSIKG